MEVLNVIDTFYKMSEKLSIPPAKNFLAFMQKNLEDGEEPEHITLRGDLPDFESRRITCIHFRDLILPCFQTITFVKSIDFANNSIGDLGMISVCALLKTNTYIKRVNLKCNNFTCIGAKLLADLLVYNETLAHINISYNNIGDEGLFALATMLQVNPTIQSLEIAGCSIGNKSFIALCTVMHTCDSIRFLDVSDNQTKVSSLSQTTLYNMMSHLCAMLKVNTALITLNISKLGITDWIVMDLLAYALGTNDKLKHVNLSGNRIKGDGGVAILKALASNSIMRHLNLNSCSIGEAGAKALSRLLIMNNSLKQIDLQHNDISCTGLSAIASGLKMNNALRVINLWGNHFSTPSCEIFSVLQGGTTNTKIGSRDDEMSKELVDKIRSKENQKKVVSLTEMLHSEKRSLAARLVAGSTDFEIYRIEGKPFAARIAVGGVLKAIDLE